MQVLPKTTPVTEEIMKDRQAWFWRRTTLQVTLFSLLAILGYVTISQAAKDSNWQLVAIIVALLAAIVWLVTIYFAMVNDAAKISSLVKDIGSAVSDARKGE